MNLPHLVYSYTIISSGNTHRDTHWNNAFPASKYFFYLPWCKHCAHIENTIASRDSLCTSSGAICWFLSAGIIVCGISGFRISTSGVLIFWDCEFGDFKPWRIWTWGILIFQDFAVGSVVFATVFWDYDWRLCPLLSYIYRSPLLAQVCPGLLSCFCSLPAFIPFLALFLRLQSEGLTYKDRNFNASFVVPTSPPEYTPTTKLLNKLINNFQLVPPHNLSWSLEGYFYQNVWQRYFLPFRLSRGKIFSSAISNNNSNL